MHRYSSSFKLAVAILFILPLAIQASTISGTLLDSDGNTITESVAVSIASYQSMEWIQSDTTENGSFSIENVETGSYWLRAEAVSSESWLLATFYPSSWNPRWAQMVNVSGDVTGMNITMSTGGKVSGAILPGDGGSFDDDDVTMGISTGMTNQMIWDVPNPSEFTSKPLPTGNLTLGFYTEDPSDFYVKTFTGNTYNGIGASQAAVVAGETTDIGDITLTVGGGISGTVTDSDENPIENVYVVCEALITEPTQTRMTFATGYTDSNGNFDVRAIPAGVGARLYFSPPGGTPFVEEWYEDAESFADATLITITSGEMTTGIDAALQAGATLYGSISWSNGDPVTDANDITLYVYDDGGNENPMSYELDTDGNWTSTSLIMPGVYTICAKSNSESHSDAPTFAGAGSFSWEADWLNADYGQTVGPFDVEFQAGGGISGQVTLPDGNPDMYIPVRLYKDNVLLMDAWTNDSGVYSFSNLPVGDYQLGAFESVWDLDPDSNYPAIFSGNATTLSQAEAITVTQGNTATANMQMVQGGIACVSVTDTLGNTYNPYGDSTGIVVYPVTLSGEVLYEVTRIGSSDLVQNGVASMLLPQGQYSFIALPLRTTNNSGDFVPLRRTFLGNAASFADAETDTVFAGEQLDVSIEMAIEGHSITGTVTNFNGDCYYGNTKVVLVDTAGYPASMYSTFYNQSNDSFALLGAADGDYRIVAMSEYYYGNFVAASTWYPNIGKPFQTYTGFAEQPSDAGVITINGTGISELVIEMQKDEFVSGIYGGEEIVNKPSGYTLSNAYPNPFNPSSTVRFNVPSTSRVRVELLNVLGQRVTLLTDEVFKAGTHSVTIDGRQLSSGTYFVRMQVPGEVLVRRVTLLK